VGTFRPLEEATGGDALGGDGEATGGGAVAALGVARERTPDGDGNGNEMDGASSFFRGGAVDQGVPPNPQMGLAKTFQMDPPNRPT
jgi:hypothetical protein